MAMRRWLCRLGVHGYRVKRAADGSRYEECRFCKKYREVSDISYGAGRPPGGNY